MKINMEEVAKIKANCELFKEWFAKCGSKDSKPLKYLK